MVRVGHQGQEFNEWHDGRYSECPLCHPQLRLTQVVKKLLDEGKVKEAAALHNATVKAQLAKAEQGELIELTDLMASKEELELRRRPK